MESLKNFLRQTLGSEYGRHRYLLAVSGGLDSMVLWHGFRSLGLDIGVAHLNHGQRGNASDEDEAFVAEQAATRRVSFHPGRIDAGLSAPASEEALRGQRLAFLEGVRAEGGYDFIVTAHHGDDQWETLFLRLLRGTGLHGLGGIRPRTGHWLRPLLKQSRRELEAYACLHGIEYREDTTNADEVYLRNRVRHRWMPVFRDLAETFGGEGPCSERLEKTLEEIREVSQWMQRESAIFCLQWSVPTTFWTRVPQRAFVDLPKPLKGKVLETLCGRWGVASLTRPQRERGIELAGRGTGRSPLSGGLGIEVSCGQLFIGPQGTPVPVIRRDGELVECSTLGWRAQVRDPRWLEGRTLRFFRPGDCLGTQKLKRWFLERGIPRPERALYPLVAGEDSSSIDWIHPAPDASLTVVSAEFPFSVRD